MTDFNFYSETYCGSLIPADAWDAVCRDAEAQMNRYERIYHVSYPQTGSRNMAVCAMAEALYEFAQLQDAGGAVQSVSVGNVSENRAAVAAPDTSAAAQAAEPVPPRRAVRRHLQGVLKCSDILPGTRP